MYVDQSNSDGCCEDVDYYLSGDLDTVEVARFERHLEKCGKCRQAVDKQEWVDGLLQSLQAAEAEKTPIKTLEATTRKVLRLHRQQRVRRSLVVVAAAAIGGVLFLNVPAFHGPEPIAANLDSGRESNNQVDSRADAATVQRRGPQEATFVTNGDAIAVALPSENDEVSIVQLFPTTVTKRRWQRQLSLNSSRFGQDGG